MEQQELPSAARSAGQDPAVLPSTSDTTVGDIASTTATVAAADPGTGAPRPANQFPPASIESIEGRRIL